MLLEIHKLLLEIQKRIHGEARVQLFVPVMDDQILQLRVYWFGIDLKAQRNLSVQSLEQTDVTDEFILEETIRYFSNIYDQHMQKGKQP